MGLLGVLPTMNFRCTKRPAVPYPTSHFCGLSSILFAWSFGHVSICNSIPFHTSTLLDGSSTYVSKRLWCHSLLFRCIPIFRSIIYPYLPPLPRHPMPCGSGYESFQTDSLDLPSGDQLWMVQNTSNSIGSSWIIRSAPLPMSPPSSFPAGMMKPKPWR